MNSASPGLLQSFDALDGLWSAVSAVCTAVAVLVAVWATHKVLEQGQKSLLKDELRAVREALAGLIAARGAYKAALHPYWRVDHTTPRHVGKPFGSGEVEAEAKVHEAVYAVEGAASVLVAALRGASALGARVWDSGDVERLVCFIEAYGEKGWLPTYLTLVAEPEPGHRRTAFGLATQVVGRGSEDMDHFVAAHFATDGMLSGRSVPDDVRQIADEFLDAARARISSGVTAFLAVGDRAAEVPRALRRFRPTAFLTERWTGGPGTDWLRQEEVPAYQPGPSGRPLRFRAQSGAVLHGDSTAGLIRQFWATGDYGSQTANDLLARGWRELQVYAAADRHNRGLLQRVEEGTLEASPLVAEQLARLADGADVRVRWPHAHEPLAAVAGRRQAAGPNVIVLDPASEWSLLASVGTVEEADPPTRAELR